MQTALFRVPGHYVVTDARCADTTCFRSIPCANTLRGGRPKPAQLSNPLPRLHRPGGLHTRLLQPARFKHDQGEPASATEISSKSFPWTTRWWPAIPMDSLDPRVPVHVDLLGKSLVVWADSKGQWHCLEDKCPHRLAPLSEGRVEGDTLMCSYHGWTFSGSGACTSIPQLSHDPKAQAAACGSRRSCTKSYPVRVAHGLMWIWPEAGDAAAAIASSQQTASFSDGLTAWFARDLPVRYDTLAENVVDASHVPFAHHGIAGDRQQGGVTEASLGPVTPEGYTATINGVLVTFMAPFHVRYTVGPMLGIELIFVPSKPGWTRILTCVPIEPPKFYPLLKRLSIKLTRSLPALYHVLDRHPLFDGDTYLVHVAERLLPVKDGIGISAMTKACYMPAAADRAPIGFRTWLEQFGSDVPTCSISDEAKMPPEMPKEQVLDRWGQHTKDCSHCKAAVALLDKLQVATVALGGLAGAMTLLSVPGVQGTAVPPGPWATVGWAAVAALCALIYPHLAGFRQKFFYEEYTHALHD